MIARLKGVLDSIENDGIVIDVKGVGYWVHMSNRDMTQIGKEGDALALWIEQVRRNEETHFCGFIHKSDRLCFRQLLNVQGVGVRVALAILSVLTVDELILAISSQDKTLLTRADGVGPKLASRIVLELKDRLSAPNITLQAPSPTTGAAGSAPGGASISSQASSDALLGLVNLGYSRSEAYLALQKALADSPPSASASDLLRLSLKSLSKI